MISRVLPLVLASILTVAAHAGPASFDLAGPTLEVKVTRGTKTLPVAEVPNLAVGDRIWIKADMPPTQSAHYLMVAAFLSGSTNPPPKDWFYRCETWNGKCARDGLSMSVPPGAQQLMVFLAPQTGGDFKTLMNTVLGRPGAFVRASQDLNQAALDHSRLEMYLSAIREFNATDPGRLKEAAPLLARSLAIKLDEKCLNRILDLQAPCLMQGQESLILNDGHSTSIVEALTSGPANDLAKEASFTPQLNYGYYSPFIASVADIARILDSFHTAQYQYIPALASPRGERLRLTLNAAPSFHNPLSVIVVAMPAVEQPQLPPLHAVDPKEIFCAGKSSLVLPVEGAPLVFSTGFAHDLTLSLTGQDGKTVEVPATADAARGSFVVDTSGLGSATINGAQGSLHGYWGFERYDGPSFRLTNAHAQSWELAAGEESGLIVGRQGTVHLRADSASCVDAIMIKDQDGKELSAEWKALRPNEIELKLPLQDAKPGSMSLLVRQYGASQPQSIAIHTFAEAGHLDRFVIHAGDPQGILKGSRLDKVTRLSINGIGFVPGKLSTRNGSDELLMVAEDAQAMGALKQENTDSAKVTLKDGRVFTVPAVVDAPRPRVTLIGKSVQPSRASIDSNIQLADPDQLPQDSRLIFSLRAETPPVFMRDATIEVATADESSSATLSLGNGTITLENGQVAVATLDPAKALGPSIFGPLRFRITVSGVNGDWQPLATLVRLPALKELKCPATPELACKLSGSDLFLIDSVSGDQQFEHPVKVPDGFLGSALPVPHPNAGQIYVKLRDNPAVINTAMLTAQEMPPSSQDAARAAARHEAAQADVASENK